jgi:Chain length determinant protein
MHPRASTNEANLPNESKAMSMSDHQIMSMRQADASENEAANGRVGWSVVALDGLAVLVERWKFIVIATLIVGALAAGVALLLPRIYTSVAYLGPLEETNAKATEVVIQSPPVLDPVIEKFPQYRAGYSLEDRRDYLSSKLYWKIVKGASPKSAIYTLSLDDREPERTQGMLNAILDRWLETLAPRPDNSARLGKTLEASETQADDLSQVISELKKRPDALVADIRSGYYPPNIVDMIKMRTETAARIIDLTQQLRSGSRDLIFKPPSLPEQPSGPNRKLIVAVAMAVTFFGLIIFFLFDWRVQIAAGKPIYAPMFARMRRAMPW